MSSKSFPAIRPCKSNEYFRWIKEQKFKNIEPAEGDEFEQAWSYRESLKNGLNSEVSLSETIYTSDKPLSKLSNLYNNKAPQLIDMIYNIPISSQFYSIHKNHLWLCERTGDYFYDPSKSYCHRFKAKIIKILDPEKESFKLKNTRPTITTITFQ
jgi:hypothetical protein